jgi:hypothetical protein
MLTSTERVSLFVDMSLPRRAAGPRTFCLRSTFLAGAVAALLLRHFCVLGASCPRPQLMLRSAFTRILLQSTTRIVSSRAASASIRPPAHSSLCCSRAMSSLPQPGAPTPSPPAAVVDTQVWTVRPEDSPASLESQLQAAAAVLQRDELVAFPTETVYGLAGSQSHKHSKLHSRL